MNCNDTLTFFREFIRMCTNMENCYDCELCNGFFCLWKAVTGLTTDDLKEIIGIAQQWSNEHPAKTRQSEFLKIFPNVRMSKDGTINLCSRNFELNFMCPQGSRCDECNAKKEYWLQEIEINENV